MNEISLLPLAVFVAVIIIARKRRQYFNVRCFNFRRWEVPRGRKLLRIAAVSLLGLAASILICFPLNAWLWGVGPVVGESYPQVQLSMTSPVLLLLFVTLVVPLEEWVCRRGLLEVFRAWKGPIVGVLVSAAMFGALHMLGPGATPLTSVTPVVAGIILGIVYLKGGFLASNLTHLGYNGAAVLLWWLS